MSREDLSLWLSTLSWNRDKFCSIQEKRGAPPRKTPPPHPQRQAGEEEAQRSVIVPALPASTAWPGRQPCAHQGSDSLGRGYRRFQKALPEGGGFLVELALGQGP